MLEGGVMLRAAVVPTLERVAGDEGRLDPTSLSQLFRRLWVSLPAVITDAGMIALDAFRVHRRSNGYVGAE